MFNFKDIIDIETTKIDTNDVKHSKKVPWVDKYRPKKLDGVVFQYEVVKMLRDTLVTGNLPHTLFYGPPGTGKTSTILAVTNELFGPKMVKERVLELNASDERGINVVRNKIVTFAKGAIGSVDKDYPCPPYKIIILDEADAMTTEAQSALRKVVEDKSNITRFCFICNYINQIIDPIASRCVKFRFKLLDEECITNKLIFIAKNESMNVSNDVVQAVSETSSGDMREAIILLQNLKYIQKYKDNICTVEDVYNLANLMSKDVLNSIDKVCFSTDIDIPKIVDLVDKVVSYGYPVLNIIHQIHKKVVESSLDDKQKSLICFHISHTEKRLSEGGDEYLQLMSVFMCIKSVFNSLDTLYNINYITETVV